MISFKEIQIVGFGSLIEETIFQLDQPGLNVIRGKVGSGKTSIPSALCWALFGYTLKEGSQVSTWQEVQPEGFAGTKVEIIFNKPDGVYRIIRCKDYKKKIKVGDKKLKGANNLLIYKDGDLDGTRNKKDKQALIENTIGYSFDLFKSAVVFGQKMKKIIEETGPQKKKVFEEAFDVGFVNEAKEIEKEDLGKLESAKKSTEEETDNLIDKADDKEESYNDALEDEKNFQENKNEGLREITEDLNEYHEELKTLKKKSKAEGNIDKLKDKVSKLEKEKEGSVYNNNKHDNIEQKLIDLEKSMGHRENKLEAKDKTCSECGQEMNKKHRKERDKKLKGEIKALNTQFLAEQEELKEYPKTDIQVIKDKLKDVRDKLTGKEAKIAQAKAYSKRLPQVKDKIKKLELKYSNLENKELKVKSTKYKKQLAKLDKRISTLKTDLKDLNRQIELKQWLIKDPLSSNGIKAYMFDSLMAKVNIALEEYSRILGFQVEFGIDLDTHRKDFYQAILYEGIVVPYEDLSGGQKQLVDTSVAFAIHDVVSEIRPTNILFMDEPFESLGVDEIETIEELVETKSRDKCLFLMTHHESFNPRNTNDILVERNKEGHTEIF